LGTTSATREKLGIYKRRTLLYIKKIRDKLNKKELEIAEKKGKGKYIESFVKDLENRPLIIEEVDEDI